MRWPGVVVAESCRHAAHAAYRRGRLHARHSGNWLAAHRLGMLAALSSRYLERRDLRPTEVLWAELAPFLLIEPEADALEALAEYLVFQEDPDRADIELIGILLNEAVRPLGPQDADVVERLRPALAVHHFDWLALFSYHNLRLLRRMVGGPPPASDIEGPGAASSGSGQSGEEPDEGPGEEPPVKP